MSKVYLDLIKKQTFFLFLKEDNGIEHVINNCEKLKKERKELIGELNKLDTKIKLKHY